METDTEQAKSYTWLRWLMAGGMTLASLHVGLTHSTAGFLTVGEALLLGPAFAGYVFAVLTARVTGMGSPAWFWLCGVCSAVLGWYSLVVWAFALERPLSMRQKVFWIIVVLFTWGPGIVLAVLIAGGVPVGSSA